MDTAAFGQSSRPSANNRNDPQSRDRMRPRTQFTWGQYTDAPTASSPSTVADSSTINARNGPQARGHSMPVGYSPRNPIGCGESIIAASSSSSTVAEYSIRNNRNGPQSRGEVMPISYSPGNQVVIPDFILATASSPSTVAESSTSLSEVRPVVSFVEVRPVVSSSGTQDVRAESIASAFVAAVASASSPSPLAETVVESPSASTASLPADDSSSTGETSNNGNGPNGDKDKRLAWNKPLSNGAASDIKPVMDTSSWPALSKSTMEPNVILPAEVLEVLTDGSSAPLSLGSPSPPSSSSEGLAIDNAKTNTPVPTSPKPMRRNGSNASSKRSSQPQSAIQGPTPATWSHNSSTNDNTQRSGYALQQTHNINDRPQQPHQHDSFKNRTGSPNYRGDGARQHSHWGRREQHRGNQDLNINRNFNGRGTHMQPRGVPRLTRPAPLPPVPPPLPPVPPPYSSAQYFPPPPVPLYGGPYGSPYGFPELAPQVPYYSAPTPEQFSGVSYIPAMSPFPVSFPAQDFQLHTRIVRQIDYYFSFNNLIMDAFLRKQMDDQGWVPIRLIADFPKVKELTRNIQIVIDAIRTSSVVEIQGDKIRPRDDRQRWPLPANFELPKSPYRNLRQDELAQQVQSISLEEKTSNNGAGESQPSTSDQVARQASDDST